MDSRLFRFLLLLVIRLRRSFGRIALALRARFASLWRSILTFARRRGQFQVRLRANDAPAVNNNPMGGHPQFSEPAKVEEEDGGTLAALPVRRPARWQDELPIYQALTSGYDFKLHPLATTPERGSQRYNLRPPISQSPDSLPIPAGQQALLSALPPLPEGWNRHVHPEGNVIFYHEGLRMFTESDIIRREKEILFHATALIQKAIQTHGVIMDELTEIVLNVDDQQRWHYYFVDHRHRLLFWVDPVKPQEDLGTDLQAMVGYSHIRYLVEARYWYASSDDLSGMSAPVIFYLDADPKFKCIVYDMELRSHCEYYPHNRTLPTGVFQDLRGMLNYAKTDMMTADSSTSPFAQDELVAILDLVNSLKAFEDDGKISDPYSIWVIARLMAYFTENQFLNFCGQLCARLNADTPLFGEQTWNRSIVFKVINLFLLTSPNEHAVRLQRIWVDGIIIQPRWKDFINRLTSELGRYTIFSTVMLAVNFSFLAVPGVVTVGSPASSIQIIIYCSVISTVGSIIFSFALLNVYNDPRFMDASPAAGVMKTLSQKKLGMARFAVMHSLPNACLIWSIILFSVALAVQIFLPKQYSTTATLAVECGILVLFAFMSMRIMWLFSMDEDADDEEASARNDSASTELERGIGLRSAMATCRTFYRC